MASISAGKTIMWIVIYFLFMFIVVFSANNIFTFYGQESIEYGGADFSNKVNPFNTSGFCDEPRTITGSTFDVFYSGDECAYISSGVPSPDICNRVEGCNWTNQSTYLWFFTKDVPEYCGGKVNTSFYNNNTPLTLPSPREICKMRDLQEDEELCSLFGCTYTEYSEMGSRSFNIGDKFSFSSVWDSVKFITGFSVSLDMPVEFQWIFSGLFFWLPFIGLMVAVYFALPIIH